MGGVIAEFVALTVPLRLSRLKACITSDKKIKCASEYWRHLDDIVVVFLCEFFSVEVST